MKLAQFKTNESAEQRLGVLVGDVVYDVAKLARALKESGGGPPSWLLQANRTQDLINRGESAVRDIEELLNDIQPDTALPIDSIEFLPAVYPGKILAIGRNYVDHAIEGGAAPPEAPLLFNKLPNSLSAHNAPIVLPPISTKVDYEAELAVVIGRRAKRISEASMTSARATCNSAMGNGHGARAWILSRRLARSLLHAMKSKTSRRSRSKVV